ncbi:MAG: hypothetical protein AAF986_11220 [Pseudomonadota bacterium]
MADGSLSEKYKFWMVWREGSPTTRFRHSFKEDAEREAERLANLNPGETFYVLKTVAAMTVEKQPIRRHKLVHDPIPF